MPQVFDPANAEFAGERTRLRELLSETEWRAAARTTINAHYTDHRISQLLWDTVHRLGLPDQATVLEPGCGSGNFIGHAPQNTHMIGVELDPITAAIAVKLYPSADIRAESFAETRGIAVDAAIGNVPFADVVLHDPAGNPGRHTIHNHFLIKSLAMTQPGGLVAALTSRYTLDSTNTAAREEMAELGDLVGAIRLASGAHRRTAGTEVVTDILIFRRHTETPDPNRDRPAWLQRSRSRSMVPNTPSTSGSTTIPSRSSASSPPKPASTPHRPSMSERGSPSRPRPGRRDRAPTNGGFVGMSWTMADARAEDFQTKHRWLSTSPESGFVQVAMAERRDATGVDVIRGLVFSRIGAGAHTAAAVTSRAEWFELLADRFDLRLEGMSPDARDRLWTTVLAAHHRWAESQRHTSPDRQTAATTRPIRPHHRSIGHL